MDACFFVTGPSGQLEAKSSWPTDPIPGVALICHPHPLHGGTMDNKVVYTLSRGYHQLGLKTVRFNFRGVGRSDGVYDEGVGEIADTLSMIHWINSVTPHEEIWLAGFSFGAAIAFATAQQYAVKHLVTVAPPVHYPTFCRSTTIHAPLLIIQGGQDDIVAPDDVITWSKKLGRLAELIYIDAANHFFDKQLIFITLTTHPSYQAIYAYAQLTR